MSGDETILGGGRFATDAEGFRAMRAYVARWLRRVWAIEGCAGIGGHVAERLVGAGEDVVDVRRSCPLGRGCSRPGRAA